MSSTVDIYSETSGELVNEDTGFLSNVGDNLEFEIDNVYIAKRGGGEDSYLNGSYFEFDLDRRAMHDEKVIAPKPVQEIVQWCAPDIILVVDEEPVLSVETTYHELTYNNIAQRIPRQVKPAMEGVPSVIFQKVESYDTDTAYLTWFAETFRKANQIYDPPCLALMFTEEDHDEKADRLANLCNWAVNSNQNGSMETVTQTVEDIASDFDPESILKTKNGRRRSWIRVDNDYVTSIPGPNPDRQGWRTKGTGNLDPYPGMAKMSEILFAYNEEGEKIRDLRIFFRNLPSDFWWFQENEDELYYRLMKEFADELYYADQSDQIDV
ncbi:hypothetical protein [Halopiger goleimassiliensis]|uniref:hypothetical protein n=1 Tax=Halopiger goleimassiliensis TaxID=1293048 RepID=UPI0012B59512|nr:hypothetical protein [Halopiger goleimassiliensis]